MRTECRYLNVPVEVANPNYSDLDFLTMKQFLVKAVELGNPKLGA
jgi:hypothetical protein